MEAHNKWFIISISSMLLFLPAAYFTHDALFSVIFLLVGFTSFIISLTLQHWYDDEQRELKMIKENRDHMNKMQNLTKG